MQNFVILFQNRDDLGSLHRDFPVYRRLKSDLSGRFNVHEVQLIHSDVGTLIKQIEAQSGPVSGILFWAHGDEAGRIECDDGHFTKEEASSMYLSAVKIALFCSCYAGVPSGAARALADRGVKVCASVDAVQTPALVMVDDQLVLTDLSRPEKFRWIEADREVSVALPEAVLEQQVQSKDDAFLLQAFYKTRNTSGDGRKALEFLVRGALEGCVLSQSSLLYAADQLTPSYVGQLVKTLNAHAASGNMNVMLSLACYYRRHNQIEKAIDLYVRLWRLNNPIAKQKIKELSETNSYAVFVLIQLFEEVSDFQQANVYKRKLIEQATACTTVNPPDLDRATELYTYGLKLSFINVECLISLAGIEVNRGNHQKALELLDEAVRLGPAHSQQIIITQLLNGLKEAVQNSPDFLQWIDNLSKAFGPFAREGNFLALARFHESCTLKTAVAQLWYEKAAKYGSLLARSILGTHHELLMESDDSDNRDEHLETACRYYTDAAEAGDVYSAYRLTRLISSYASSSPQVVEMERRALHQVMKKIPAAPETRDDQDLSPIATLRRKAKRKIELLSL